MRFLILIPLISLVYSAPQPLQEDEFPFSTDNFPTFLDESNSAEEKDELALSYNDQAEALKKRLKMKSMFNTNGPPSIGTDLFSNSAVEENIKKLSYEGSGAAVEVNPEKSEEVSTTPLTISEEALYSAENSTAEDSAIESSSNSSLLYDQNTSDAEVEAIADTIYQKNEAIAVIEAALEDKEETTTVLDIGEYTGNNTESSEIECPPPKMCARNCFVTINEDGCQDCQCLWIADNCDTDKDCTHRHQFCDLGKCNCQPGYQQNMKKSGVCEVETQPKKKMSGVFPETEEEDELDTNNISQSNEELRRFRRSAKPRRSERLEWPGRLELW